MRTAKKSGAADKGYRGMIIHAEKGLSGRTVYRVIRFCVDGKAVPVPWTYATLEAAQDYVSAHGF